MLMYIEKYLTFITILVLHLSSMATEVAKYGISWLGTFDKLPVCFQNICLGRRCVFVIVH
jgi:hypothetical protein